MDTSSEVQKCLVELGPKSYSSVEIMSFTSNLIESNMIGFGGCGKVYKGQLPNGIFIAVKVLENIDVGKDTFMAEVDTMGNARHLNLIKLYGYCFEDNMKVLVYEYMENGSLDRILYENLPINNIEWVKLYDIAIGVANGLKYLHHDLEEQIIHYDIKAANVLLGKNFSAKLADFGLAKNMKKDVSRVDVLSIRGTYGYIAPEIYNPGLKASRKCDVYSFGMMLFEILGKRSNGVEENWFPKIVWKQNENGNLEHFITTECGIAKEDTINAIILCKVAFWCVQENPDRRPSMKDVVLMLGKEKQVEDPPCPSSHFRGQSDEMELDSTDPLNIIAGPSHASVAGNDGGVSKPQMKSNKRQTRSPNVLEEDMATSVPNKGRKLPTTKLVGKTTALKYKEMILQLIAKDEVVKIGVHGMGGVGKTTIFKHVHNQLLAEGKRFDKVIWVIVSKDGNITNLQNDLAKELDLKLSDEDTELRRSSLLLQELEKRKRVMFFFDDMWKKISLDEIGIPEPTQENGFKLILTTRLVDVCKRMGCHKDNTIKIEGLPKDEAWELFMDKVDCVLTPKVKKIAEMVAKKCSGLPLAIITVGATMRGNSNIYNWRVVLNDLNLKDPNNRTTDMEDNVYECLKFSYDRLENEKQRKCFLCCALYPEDQEIETRDLIEFWIMDGIIEGRNKQDELVEGQYILDKLKDHCLLESICRYEEEYYERFDRVKMHDSIREMALRLTNKSFMLQNSSYLWKLPKEKEWEIDLERASFMYNGIVAISISPICPKLSTLVLRNHFLESVAHNFFVHMKCLKVLDLRCRRNAYLELLPDSISDLLNLRALRLGGYIRLKKLPSLAKLVLLRWLELNMTGIEELPEGMEMLVNLRCLNLHRVPLKKKIPMGLITKLSALEELYLGGIEIDKVYDIGSGECFTKELLSLKKLEILNVSFNCLSDYASYIGSSEFNGLKYLFLTIGEVFNHGRYQYDYYDSFYAIGEVFNHIDMRSSKDENMFGLLKGLRELVQIKIRGGNKILCVWSSKDENQEFTATGTSSSCWLQSLETIYIDGCTKLYTIFEGIPNYTFDVLPVFCLKTLQIYVCHNLKNVFPSSRMLQLLQNLEDIIINDCDELEDLIGDNDEEETETPISFPRLKYLYLSNLPKLKRIWRGMMICDSLECVTVADCLELKRLPEFSRLHDLYIKNLPKLEELWICDSLVYVTLQSTKLHTIFEGIPNYISGVLPVFCLKVLSIVNCNNLKNVFPSSRMLQLLQNLERIEIRNCDELEELIGEEGEEETETPIAIPRLKYLEIGNLPKLKELKRLLPKEEFSTCWLQRLEEIKIAGCTELYPIFEGIPSYTSGVLSVFCLKKLEISRCHNLKNVFPSSRMLQLFQTLEEIIIFDCDELEELIGDEREEEIEKPISIPKLKKLEISDLPKLKRICRGAMKKLEISVLPVFFLKELRISDCNNLKNVFPSSRLLQLLQNLEKIRINHCDELEELIGDDEEEETETPISFPRLIELEISYLPKLKRIWRGVMICDSIEYIRVIYCYKLKSLPQLKGEEQLAPPPALRYIKGGRKWWDSLEWDPAYPKNILEPLFVENGWFIPKSDVEDSTNCTMSEEEKERSITPNLFVLIFLLVVSNSFCACS